MIPVEPLIFAVPQVAPRRTARQVSQQRACAAVALRCCAQRCGAPPDGWEKDGNGAPLPNEGFYWSVSYGRHWCAAVIARYPVGIDIEQVVPRPRRLHDALADAGEWKLLADRSWYAFYRLWTAKEAVLKATGAGIGGLLECRLTAVESKGYLVLECAGKSWRVEHRQHANHIAAVTCGTERVQWRVTSPCAVLSTSASNACRT